MIYDTTPEVFSSIGNTTVNASVYDVDCASVPQAQQVSYDWDFTFGEQSMDDGFAILVFRVDDVANKVNLAAPCKCQIFYVLRGTLTAVLVRLSRSVCCQQ